MIPKPAPPRMSPEAVKVWSRILDRERAIRDKATRSRFWPHPTLKEIVASCDESIKQILRDYPEASK